MKNLLLNGPSANAGAAASCLCMTRRPDGTPVTLVQGQPIAFHNYTEMTRVAAAGGGEPGSHPAWDPV